MKWTQKQGIAFESARECITALMSIYTAQLIEEREKHGADSAVVHRIRAKITALSGERAALMPSDDATVAQVRKTYGALVRQQLTALKQHSEMLVA